MICTADNQIFHINIKSIGYIIKSLEVWLNRITTPFAQSDSRATSDNISYLEAKKGSKKT